MTGQVLASIPCRAGADSGVGDADRDPVLVHLLDQRLAEPAEPCVLRIAAAIDWFHRTRLPQSGSWSGHIRAR